MAANSRLTVCLLPFCLSSTFGRLFRIPTMAEHVIVLNQSARFYLPPDNGKKPQKRSKSKSARNSKNPPSLKAASDAELYDRITDGTGTADFADLQNIFTHLVDPPPQNGGFFAHTWNYLASQVVNVLSEFSSVHSVHSVGSVGSVGSVQETPSVNGKVPRLREGSDCPPLCLINVELGTSSCPEETFFQRLERLLGERNVQALLVAVAGRHVSSLDDISRFITQSAAWSETEENSAEKDTEEVLTSFLRPMSEPMSEPMSASLSASMSKRMSGSMSASVSALVPALVPVFVIEDAVSVPRNVMEMFLTLLEEKGRRTVVVSCCEFLTSTHRCANHFYAFTRNISAPSLLTQAGTNLLRFLEDCAVNHLLLGPNLTSFLMNELCSSNCSPEQMGVALKVCCIRFYSQFYLSRKTLKNVETSNEKTAELFSRLRNLPSCRKFIESCEAEAKIRLLMDDKYFLKFLEMELIRRDSFRRNVMTLLSVVVELLSSVTVVFWWTLYIHILKGVSWDTCVQLRGIGVDTEDKIVASLEKCRKMIVKRTKSDTVQKRHAEDVSEQWLTCLSTYQQKWHTDRLDVVDQWKLKSRQGSPLIALLDDLCAFLPSYDNIVFYETLVFDDTELLRERTSCDLRNSTESLLQDPRRLFPVLAGQKGIIPLPDLSLVRSSLLTERRTLNLQKSMAVFQAKLSEQKQKEDQDEDEDERMEEDEDGRMEKVKNGFSETSRARFLRCLPGLQALGILSLSRKGQKNTYSIV